LGVAAEGHDVHINNVLYKAGTCMGEIRNAYRVLIRTPERERPHRRNRSKYET
jgi:hypothetical protein